ncbi:precorrin-3B synthase [Marssonina coronariae]|uniref:Precorrin-3B synthase n=1 Tax=Diplocarpon coronariae TaxID=2795749 RepID=A0A218YTV4_9HELO|nr:precorrin-3B synthase [Marssonina coronariae]
MQSPQGVVGVGVAASEREVEWHLSAAPAGDGWAADHAEARLPTSIDLGRNRSEAAGLERAMQRINCSDLFPGEEDLPLARQRLQAVSPETCPTGLDGRTVYPDVSQDAATPPLYAVSPTNLQTLEELKS